MYGFSSGIDYLWVATVLIGIADVGHDVSKGGKNMNRDSAKTITLSCAFFLPPVLMLSVLLSTLKRLRKPVSNSDGKDRA